MLGRELRGAESHRITHWAATVSPWMLRRQRQHQGNVALLIDRSTGWVRRSPVRNTAPQSGFGPTTSHRWRSKNLVRSTASIRAVPKEFRDEAACIGWSVEKQHATRFATGVLPRVWDISPHDKQRRSSRSRRKPSGRPASGQPDSERRQSRGRLCQHREAPASGSRQGGQVAC
jgi:hypothetical protein